MMMVFLTICLCMICYAFFNTGLHAFKFIKHSKPEDELDKVYAMHMSMFLCLGIGFTLAIVLESLK